MVHRIALALLILTPLAAAAQPSTPMDLGDVVVEMGTPVILIYYPYRCLMAPVGEEFKIHLSVFSPEEGMAGVEFDFVPPPDVEVLERSVVGVATDLDGVLDDHWEIQLDCTPRWTDSLVRVVRYRLRSLNNSPYPLCLGTATVTAPSWEDCNATVATSNYWPYPDSGVTDPGCAIVNLDANCAIANEEPSWSGVKARF